MLETVVHEDDADVVTQALNDAMDRIEETTTGCGGEVLDIQAAEPPNAAEIGSTGNRNGREDGDASET